MENIYYAHGLLQGQGLSADLPETGDGFAIQGSSGKILRLSEQAHTSLDGMTKYGKTNLLFQLYPQIRAEVMRHGGVIICNDPRLEFYRRFGQEPQCLLLGQDCHWNLCEEILYGLDLSEAADPAAKNQLFQVIWERSINLSAGLFQQRLKTAKEAFFPEAGYRVFAAVLTVLCYSALAQPEFRQNLHNGYLASLLQTGTPETITQLIRDFGVEDFNSIMFLLDHSFRGCEDVPAGSIFSEESAAIWSEVTTTLGNLLVGDWAKPGTLSVHQLIHEKQGAELFLPFSLDKAASYGPMCRALVDYALQQALSNNNRNGGKVYFVLDELPLISDPPLGYLSHALNYGLGMNLRIFAAWQNVGQLETLYGKEKAQAILGGFTQNIFFHTAPESTQWAGKRLGKVLKLDYTFNTLGQRIAGTPRMADAAEAWVVSNLNPGDILVKRPDNCNPIHFHILETK
jgi:hypothetical protein